LYTPVTFIFFVGSPPPQIVHPCQTGETRRQSSFCHNFTRYTSIDDSVSQIPIARFPDFDHPTQIDPRQQLQESRPERLRPFHQPRLQRLFNLRPHAHLRSILLASLSPQ
jgi:hypothetical protein